MDHKEAASKLMFSIDLLPQVSRHIDFLEKVAEIPDLKDEHVLRRAAYRYEKYWIPLAAEHRDECLTAPLDIEWIWHCHMLSPKNYESDCIALVGTVVNHTFYNKQERALCLQAAKKHWLQKYGDKDEPFAMEYSILDKDAVENFTSSLSYDLVAAAQRQSTFYDKIASTEYKNEENHENVNERYKQYIYLCKLLPSLPLTPSIGIDLMWHTHQSNPLAYKFDMGRILRRLLQHDDTSTDQTVGSKLHEASQLTLKSWERFYNEPFHDCTYRCVNRCFSKCVNNCLSTCISNNKSTCTAPTSFYAV
ncbi:uncharacterized protein LOC123559048 [Mercenaria mercenaria]|uniref:uncharacterized protein LOC123559048 n=1 Tax=Mercenaria mercenaria TaxID=6596 RepID=UPI00234EE19B|nr:uncharacterized protein LOC123559048 [Mercenaria mercenaria]